MPCYSKIVETKITDQDRLVSALKEMKIKVLSVSKDQVSTSIGTFIRQRNGNFAYQGTEDITLICRKYGETTARAWQQKNGYSVFQNIGGRKLIIQKN